MTITDPHDPTADRPARRSSGPTPHADRRAWRPDLQRLTDELIDTGGAQRPRRSGSTCCPSARPAAELARSVERDVFLEYFGNTPRCWPRSTGPTSRAASSSAWSTTVAGPAAGAMRLILPSPAGLKTLDDLERAWAATGAARCCTAPGSTSRRAQVWDIATIAVTPDYRGASSDGLISLALYQGVIQLAPPPRRALGARHPRPGRARPDPAGNRPPVLTLRRDRAHELPRLAVEPPGVVRPAPTTTSASPSPIRACTRSCSRAVGLEAAVSIPAWDASPAPRRPGLPAA